MSSQGVKWAVVLALWANVAAAARPARVAVVVGSNSAAEGRAALRYAHGDAQRMADVLVQVGDFRREDVEVLLDPAPERVLAALDRKLQALAHRGAAESMLVFYYSGHADQRALYPGGRPLGLEALRQRVDAPQATVRLGIIDACRGGGWTQTKGLHAEEKPFAVHVPLVLKSEGSVLIASSSGLENAHEAESLQGSFFTHHLVAGLRGAADAGGDGEVSVVEAFGYARELTVRDAALQGVSPQHPSFDLNLRGRSDVALTRVAASDSRLRLVQAAGPLRVLQAATGGQVAELPVGKRSALLALPPGRYLVVRHDGEGPARAQDVTLAAGQTVELEEGSLKPVAPQVLALKGPGAPRYLVTVGGLGHLARGYYGGGVRLSFERALGESVSLGLSTDLVSRWPGLTVNARVFPSARAPTGLFLGASLGGNLDTRGGDMPQHELLAGTSLGYTWLWRGRWALSAAAGGQLVSSRNYRILVSGNAAPYTVTAVPDGLATWLRPRLELGFGAAF